MATISSPGIGSGLDVKTIVSQLMAIEQQPKDQLAAAANKIQTQISEVGKVTSALSTLEGLSSKLSSSSFWNQTVSSSSSTAVSVTSTNTALPANYSVQVQQLASSQSLIGGQTFASSSAAVGTGTLTIQMGTWGAGQTTFTASSTPSSASIAVTATDTVSSLRDKINSAGIGVSASILSDSSGARLVLTSNSTGAANGFRLTTSGATGGMATMGYDPSTHVTGATQTSAAANANATINGVSVTSSSNIFSNVMDGVSLTANAVTTAAATVSVSADTATIKTTLQSFATAYSALNSLIATDTKYDSTSKQSGPLQGDSTVVGVQTSLRTLLGATSTASSAFSRMSDVGFQVQQDGSLTLNSTTADNALTNLSQMKALFVGNTSTSTSAQGFAQQFYNATYNMLTIGGSVNSHSSALSDRLQRNQNQQTAMDVRLARTQAMLEAQYGALDTQMASMNSLSSYVTQQVAQWAKSG